MGEHAEYAIEQEMFSGDYRVKIYPLHIRKALQRIQGFLASKGIKKRGRKSLLIKYAEMKGWKTRNYISLCRKIAVEKPSFREFTKVFDEKLIKK